MDELDEEYRERNPKLRAAIVVLDIGVADDDGDHWTVTRYRFASAADDWDVKLSSSAHAAGLVRIALEALVTGEP